MGSIPIGGNVNTFKQICIELRQKDHTLNEIARITKRPKTSIFFHIQNVPLSQKKKKEIIRANIERLKRTSPNKKGKSLKSFKKFGKWNKNNVFFISHFLFDGEIRYNGCVYINRSKILINKMKDAIGKIYSYPPKNYFIQESGVYKIAYYNVALASYIKKRSIQLIKQAPYLVKELKRKLIQAFFDDEGCIDFRPKANTRRIRGYQKNIFVLELIQKLLVDFDMGSKIVKPNEIVITGKENLNKFQKEINFSAGVKINGNRSNSTWKKSLEKREILDRAIHSYQN
ncbi:hypothetical protein EPN83_03350 [Patescibacteria group bacterium]|nr:MAG: hypothetical protein EPN83_03350 [Patescibacteria group bacterium]